MSSSTDGEDAESFSGWVVKAYHDNVFFFTIACLVALVSYKSTVLVLIAYAGVLGKLCQMIGLFLGKEIMCKAAHGFVVACNVAMFVISVVNYE